MLEVTGWAITAPDRVPADWVLAFSGDRLLMAGSPGKARPDVARDYGGAALASGFTLTAQRIGTSHHLSRLRVFALANNKASELQVSEQVLKGVEGAIK